MAFYLIVTYCKYFSGLDIEIELNPLFALYSPNGFIQSKVLGVFCIILGSKIWI